MNDYERLRWEITRRTFLGRATRGVGTAALATLLSPALLAPPSQADNRLPAPKATAGRAS